MVLHYAEADEIQKIAPAVSRPTAHMLANNINLRIRADDPETEHLQFMCYKAIQAVLESEGIITPYQSEELSVYMNETCHRGWRDTMNHDNGEEVME